MELFSAIPADPFLISIAIIAAVLMLLAIGLLRRTSVTSGSDPQSPTYLCLKCLDEGHEPVSAFEFVADWGPKANKREFQDYAKRLKQGRPLDEVLDQLRMARPSVETELLIACLTSRAQTNRFSAVSSEIVRQAVVQREQALSDMNFLIGGSRRWVIGLVWVGVLGGAMLLVAIPLYTNILLHSGLGRVLISIVLALETVGLLLAGRMFSLHTRLEKNLSEP